MKCCRALLLGLLFWGGLMLSGHAQSPQTPALRRALARTTADTTRVLLLADLSATFRYSRYDSVRYYASQGLALARRIGYAKGEGRCLSRLALLQAERGNLPQALRTDLRALDLHQLARDADGTARTLNQAGLLYQALDDYRPALAYYFRAKAIYDHSPHLDDSQLVSVLTNLGSTYVGRGQLDSAAYFLNQAYALTTRSRTIAQSYWGNPLPYVLREMGLLEAAEGRISSAIDYYRRSARAALPENDRRSACRAYQYLAELYHERGQADSSIFYARRALQTGQTLPYVVGVVRTSRLLADVFATRRQRDSTLKYLLIRQTAEDSLYNPQRIKQLDAIGFAEQQRLQQLENERADYAARLRNYALWGGLGVLVLLVLGLSYHNRRQRLANAELQRLNAQVTHQSQELTAQRDRLAEMLQGLRTAQQQLMLREKMASLGELMAGVAHEIQQPAQAIRNLAGVSEQLCQELRQELVKGEELQPADLELLDEMLLTLARHQAKISQHSQRAGSIVRGMLEYGGSQPAARQPTDLNALAEDYLRLTYHDMRAKQRNFHAALLPRLDPAVGTVEVVRHDLGRVLISLFANAFYAVQERRQQTDAATDDASEYVPQVMLTTERTGPQQVRICVRDNGLGIPAEAQPHVFERFFSTKPADEGPGLGLPLSRDIVHSLGGTLTLHTEPGAFTELVVTLPVPAVAPIMA
ncbi:tetratricopeptide repeat-containing sensor histidine kinase [Hymenobacter jeollabukensis]|uniref:histidine kinase n=1 Tax=Hymenobacter jeollabukensis TaxID=2025313 RepID=A0A5R8WRE8_9BACT|nr:ATP-binding protein [Hymenobacter jeollabukensis]TLM93309.1 tetratricopeptide repeat protein [Hymenobacter jeollabukensis]